MRIINLILAGVLLGAGPVAAQDATDPTAAPVETSGIPRCPRDPRCQQAARDAFLSAILSERMGGSIISGARAGGGSYSNLRRPTVIGFASGYPETDAEALGFASEAASPVNGRLTMPETESVLIRMMERLAQSWPIRTAPTPDIVVAATTPGLVPHWSAPDTVTVPLHLLLDETLTDDEMAFWLAHQLASRALEHTPVAARRPQGSLSSMIPSGSSGDGSGQASDARSRVRARMADEIAFDLLLRADYDAAAGAEQALSRLRATDSTTSGSGQPEASTFHNTAERLDVLARYVARVYSTQEVTRPAAYGVLRSDAVHAELDDGRIIDDALRSARRLQSEGDTSAALTALQPALSGRFAGEPVVLNFAAELHALRGDIDQADALYALADRSPNQTREGLAAHIRLLNEAGRPDDARRVLERRRQPDTPDLSGFQDLVRRDAMTTPASPERQ